jgi:fumarate hydratase subunit alpha/L(+)-tartrate dehydratase alpha subunit
VLETIHRNVNIADAEEEPRVQDTGIAVYSCRVGEHFPLHPRASTRLEGGALRARRSSILLRSNACTRSRARTRAEHRLPAADRALGFIEDWDGLDVKCVPKGSGSENMSFLKMCVPADGVKGSRVRAGVDR